MSPSHVLLLNPFIFNRMTKQFQSFHPKLTQPPLAPAPLYSKNALTTLPKCSNIQPTSSLTSRHSPDWSPYELRQPPPHTHLPSFFALSYSTILLFSPTGSTGGRLERQWAASMLLLTHWPMPPPQPPPTVTVPCLEKRAEEGMQRKEKERKATTTSEETHTFHTWFQQEKAAVTGESPVGLKHSQCRAAQAQVRAHQQTGQITLTHWTPCFI